MSGRTAERKGIFIAPRDAAWAARLWPRCLEGLDPVATYGPEVLDTPTHPGDRYWAIVETRVRELGQVADEGDIAGGLSAGALEEEIEVGMAWANRYENRHMWTYGLAFFPEHRGQAKGQGYEVSRAIQAGLFADPEVSALVTLVYSSNPAAMRYNGLQLVTGDPGERPTWLWAGKPHRRLVGHIVDAAGPGTDLWIFQTTRAAWLARARPIGSGDCTEGSGNIQPPAGRTEPMSE